MAVSLDLLCVHSVIGRKVRKNPSSLGKCYGCQGVFCSTGIEGYSPNGEYNPSPGQYCRVENSQRCQDFILRRIREIDGSVIPA